MVHSYHKQKLIVVYYVKIKKIALRKMKTIQIHNRNKIIQIQDPNSTNENQQNNMNQTDNNQTTEQPNDSNQQSDYNQQIDPNQQQQDPNQQQNTQELQTNLY